MPASTVTVLFSALTATNWSRERIDNRLSLLSAILLKQWRVPRALSLLCDLTKLRTWSREVALVTRSVLNWKLPDQFFNFSSGMALRNGAMTGAAAIAEASLRKRRLCIAAVRIAK